MTDKSQKDLRRAWVLYLSYKTTSPEYAELAKRLGQTVGQLNRKFSNWKGDLKKKKS